MTGFPISYSFFGANRVEFEYQAIFRICRNQVPIDVWRNRLLWRRLSRFMVSPSPSTSASRNWEGDTLSGVVGRATGGHWECMAPLYTLACTANFSFWECMACREWDCMQPYWSDCWEGDWWRFEEGEVMEKSGIANQMLFMRSER